MHTAVTVVVVTSATHVVDVFVVVDVVTKDITKVFSGQDFLIQMDFLTF